MARIRMTMMRYAPAGYGGTRRSPEDVKREGWQEHGLLAVSADDPRLSWPEREIAAMEPEPMRVLPSAQAISALERTFDWALWITEAERKLIWSRAARVPWKVISGEMGCDRTTAWRRWQLALTKIAARLNAT